MQQQQQVGVMWQALFQWAFLAPCSGSRYSAVHCPPHVPARKRTHDAFFGDAHLHARVPGEAHNGAPVQVHHAVGAGRCASVIVALQGMSL